MSGESAKLARQMSQPVKIDDLTEAFEACEDEHAAYADRETGRVFVVSTDMMQAAEDEGDDEEGGEWGEAAMRQVREILADFAHRRYVPLPDQATFPEHRHMQQFVAAVESPKAAEELARALQGPAAVRAFQDAATRQGLLESWLRYRIRVLRQHLLDWARANGLAVDETPGRTDSAGLW